MTQRPLNATAAALLGLLHEAAMTGWDLAAVAQQRIGNFWNITQSQVYRELSAMTKAGLVVAGEAGPRDRKPYLITDTGRAAFQEWLGKDPAMEQIRFPLLLTIMFAEHLPKERLAEMINAHRAAHARQLTEYRQMREQLRAGGDDQQARFRLATLEFGLHYEAAALEWFDALPEILDHQP